MNEDVAFVNSLRGYRLTTAEVLYYMPDHPDLLQTFIWQTMDLAPRFPRIARFLDYWRREIDAAIHSVNLAHCDGVAPSRWRAVGDEFAMK